MAKWTRQAILNTFESLLEEKSFDKITVVELVERCGVNRNTFYYYFQDIYALLEAWMEQNRGLQGDIFADNLSLQDVFFRAAEFVRENKKIIYHIYKSASHMTLRRHLEKETYSHTMTYIGHRAAGLAVDAADIHALAILYTSAMTGMLYHWLNDEMRYDPAPIVRRICKIVDEDIEQLLQKLSNKASEANDETCVSK